MSLGRNVYCEMKALTQELRRVVMFIHEMSRAECNDALLRAKSGRLACAHDNQPYVLPLNFAFDGSSNLYFFTTLGQKIDWMRSNPLVCVEIDEVESHNQWSSVIVFGNYEELPDKPEYEPVRAHAYEFLQKRVMWWEPAYISLEHQDNPHSPTPIFFRIKIEDVTGHRANPDEAETDIPAAPAADLVQARRTAHGESEWTRILKAALVWLSFWKRS